MLAHVSIQCADLEASARFYDAVLAPLGGGRAMEGDDAIGYGVPPSAEFWIGRQQRAMASGSPTSPSRHPTEMRCGPSSTPPSPPGPSRCTNRRSGRSYHPDYYGAFVRDPDGNNIEAVCHTPE